MVRCLCALAIALAILSDAAAFAQATRAEEIRARREEKAARKEAHRRPLLEQALFVVEDRLLIERVLGPPRGLHLRLGGVQEGSGLGAGPGYRYNTGPFDLRASAAGSVKGYFIAEGALRFPGTRDDSLYAVRDGPYVEFYARRRDFPQEDFFGLGPDSLKANRSNYAIRDTFARVQGGVRRRRWLTAAVNVGYLDPSVGVGTDTRMPSITDLFRPRDIPGLSPLPSFLVTEPYVEITTIDRPLNRMSGGRYRVSFSRYDDRDFSRFSFDRWDVDLRQYISFFSGSRTIALRAMSASATPDPGHDVPFFLQPYLGGAQTLRSFRTFRFRDRSALLLQAEYRWRINELIAGALFYDAGAVARRVEDVGSLEKNYGIGMRVGSRTGVVFRADLAFGGRDGTLLLLRFDDVF
jgi:hypothetical protein